MEKRGGLWLGGQLLKLVKEREVRKREWSLTRVVFGQVAYCGPPCCPITLVSVGPVYSGIFLEQKHGGRSHRSFISFYCMSGAGLLSPFVWQLSAGYLLS